MRDIFGVKTHPANLLDSCKVLAQAFGTAEQPLRHLKPRVGLRARNLSQTNLDCAIGFVQNEQAAIAKAKFLAKFGWDNDSATLTHLHKF